MSSRGCLYRGIGRAATNARTVSLRGPGVPLMAARLSRSAIAFVPYRRMRLIDQLGLTSKPRAARDCQAVTARSKFCLICLEGVSANTPGHRRRGLAWSVLKMSACATGWERKS